MAFHVGQLVVCVKAGPSGDCSDIYWRPTLREKAIYTVAESFIHPSGTPAVVLEGITNNHPLRAWKTSRFRPVRKTSIEVFTALLNPVPTKQDA